MLEQSKKVNALIKLEDCEIVLVIVLAVNFCWQHEGLCAIFVYHYRFSIFHTLSFRTYFCKQAPNKCITQMVKHGLYLIHFTIASSIRQGHNRKDFRYSRFSNIPIISVSFRFFPTTAARWATTPIDHPTHPKKLSITKKKQAYSRFNSLCYLFSDSPTHFENLSPGNPITFN